MRVCYTTLHFDILYYTMCYVSYMILLIMYFIRILILEILFKADEIEYKTYRGGDIEWGKI